MEHLCDRYAGVLICSRLSPVCVPLQLPSLLLPSHVSLLPASHPARSFPLPPSPFLLPHPADMCRMLGILQESLGRVLRVRIEHLFTAADNAHPNANGNGNGNNPNNALPAAQGGQPSGNNNNVNSVVNPSAAVRDANRNDALANLVRQAESQRGMNIASLIGLGPLRLPSNAEKRASVTLMVRLCKVLSPVYRRIGQLLGGRGDCAAVVQKKLALTGALDGASAFFDVRAAGDPSPNAVYDLAAQPMRKPPASMVLDEYKPDLLSSRVGGFPRRSTCLGLGIALPHDGYALPNKQGGVKVYRDYLTEWATLWRRDQQRRQNFAWRYAKKAYDPEPLPDALHGGPMSARDIYDVQLTHKSGE